MANPVNDDYRTIVHDSGDPGYVNRLLIGTACTGLVRIEWHQAMTGQIIPTNWSKVQMLSFMNAYYPLRWQVDDAQNLIVKHAIENDFEWVLFIEHDTLIPANAFMIFNEYIRSKAYPVVSGLYYTRSVPAEPIIYRGRGTSFYTGWTEGDLVMADGIPTGCLLVHAGLLRAMWAESEEYTVNGATTRHVFRTPNKIWVDPETMQFNMTTGTSDLAWCSRIMDENFFVKSGWDAFQNMKWPFLVDTNLFCSHINPNGEQFPKDSDRKNRRKEEKR